MKKLLYITALSLGLWSCAGNSNETTSNQNEEENSVEMTEEEMAEENAEDEIQGKEINGMMSYGEEITIDGAINGSELLASLGDQDSLKIKVEAGITSCCQKKGCWMRMDLGDGEEMMVRFKDYGFFVPKDSEGKTAIIDGQVKRTVIPVDELKHYAEDAGKSQEEIDAITEPKEEITFLANGVLIKS